MTIQTKFNVGDTVWFMHDNKALCSTVIRTNIVITEHYIHEIYSLERTGADTFQYHAQYLHPTKEALLVSL